MTSCIRLRTCDHCHHLATSTTELTKHVQNCERFEKTCVNCGTKEHSDYAFRIHLRNCLKKRQSFSSQPRPFRCHACGFKSLGRKELTRHITLQHGGSGSLQDFDVELPDDDALKQEYDVNRRHILKQHEETDFGGVYNFPTNDLNDPEEIQRHLSYIYSNSQKSFRINVAVGLILRDIASNEMRYFIPYTNEYVMPQLETITKPSDVDRVVSKLKNIDIREHVNSIKPKSSLKPYFVTNLVYYVYNTNYPLGCETLRIPDVISKKRSILTLQKFRGVKFDDNLCIFRCLYYFRHKTISSIGVNALFQNWCDHKNIPPNVQKFKGVNFKDLVEFENLFHTNINVFEMDLVTEFVTPVYLTQKRHQQTMYMNVYKNHLSLVTNFGAYAKRFTCSKCSRHFIRLDSMRRHQKTCSDNLRIKYKGGYKEKPTNIFEDLQTFGVLVEPIIYDFVACYDFEAFLEKIHDPSSKKLKYTFKHHAISVSINSNVSGFDTPKNFMNENLEHLLHDMVEHLTQIQTKTSRIMREKLEKAFEELDLRIKMVEPKTKTNTDQENKTENVGFDGESTDEDDDIESEHDRQFIDDEEIEGNENYDNPYLTVQAQNRQTEIPPQQIADGGKHVHKCLLQLRNKLERYCDQLPVLGFNSMKYDLNLIKSKLIGALKLARDPDAHVIKRANAYVCISNKLFKFLDVTSYLAPGVSYAKFLKAYHVEEQKSYFCYEFLDSYNKLNFDGLPPSDAFYSSLKGKNVLQDDGKSVDENYALMQDLWEKEGFQTLGDLLAYYNNRDVLGFVQAIVKMQDFYKGDNVSLFKETVTISNLARRELFRSTDAVFPLFSYKTRDIHRIIQQNLVGGPSIIFNRKMKAGETQLHGNGPLCKIVKGYDCNSLYPRALSMDMPTGLFVDRRAETNFRAEISQRHLYMFAWMDIVAQDENIKILHKMNNEGKEVRWGPYFLDGACFETDPIRVYEFMGDYWHHCPICQKTPANPKHAERQKKARERTEQRLDFLRAEGLDVVTIYECQFLNQYFGRDDINVEDFTERYMPPYYKKKRTCTPNIADLVRALKNEEIFGLVECDIELIDEKEDAKNFAHFPPIFCTTEVSLESDVIGEHMYNYMIENGLNKKPRRLLASSTKANRILLATPLLKWYLDKGFRISDLHRVIEFTPQKCFKPIIDKITTIRRSADHNPQHSILADTAKLRANSFYGSLIMNKAKFRQTTYVSSLPELQRLFNDPRFVHCTEIGDGVFEVELLKRNIVMDGCNYLGFFVLNYAKLILNQFVYDVLGKYMQKNTWECVECDTDSIYAGWASQNMSDLVKPELKQEFVDKIENSCFDNEVSPTSDYWFPRTCCEKHKLFDKRTPGLFKLEQSGDAMYCLSSKTYLVCDKNDFKMSCKGVMKRSVENPLQTFMSVLESKQKVEVTNFGFRAFKNTVYTYEQKKTGFSYFYCKRKVLADGMHTEPLDIVLTPWPDYNQIIVSYDSILNNWARSEIEWEGVKFFSAKHLYMYHAAVLHNEAGKANQILDCKFAKELNELHTSYTATNDWHMQSKTIMEEVLNLKFEQSFAFRNALRESGDKTLLFPGFDKLWECGISKRYLIVSKPNELTGNNLMGKIICEKIRPLLNDFVEPENDSDDDDTEDAEPLYMFVKRLIGNRG